jgi:hypothetical protein
MSGRHLHGRPVGELLAIAAENNWDTSLLSVHASRHRPYAPLPPTAPDRATRWIISGDLYDTAC